MDNSFNTEIKPFKDITTIELYKVLKLRNEVFIVEQNCIYQDIDDKDIDAEHVLIWKDKVLVAYARILGFGIAAGEISIGRVIVNKDYRSLGLGHKLMNQTLNHIKNSYPTIELIKISAQEHLQKFYEQHGFKKVSDMYLEDGIPHIEMSL